MAKKSEAKPEAKPEKKPIIPPGANKPRVKIETGKPAPQAPGN